VHRSLEIDGDLAARDVLGGWASTLPEEGGAVLDGRGRQSAKTGSGGGEETLLGGSLIFVELVFHVFSASKVLDGCALAGGVGRIKGGDECVVKNGDALLGMNALIRTNLRFFQKAVSGDWLYVLLLAGLGVLSGPGVISLSLPEILVATGALDDAKARLAALDVDSESMALSGVLRFENSMGTRGVGSRDLGAPAEMVVDQRFVSLETASASYHVALRAG
jgi:hypothetical protein